jgi:flagellar hook assembly protein FlgD
MLGQEISVSDLVISKKHSMFKWDLKNKNGTRVASGSYIVILESVNSNGKHIRKKIQVGVKSY